MVPLARCIVSQNRRTHFPRDPTEGSQSGRGEQGPEEHLARQLIWETGTIVTGTVQGHLRLKVAECIL